MAQISKGEAKRRQILILIRQCESENRQPSVRFMMERTGIRSYDALSRHIKVLQSRGELKQTFRLSGRQ
ncbi:hypothetical protein DUZ99_08030 [Xylanibacillus composti]|nr:hypothetical protein [Xylanibacillus composti]